MRRVPGSSMKCIMRGATPVDVRNGRELDVVHRDDTVLRFDRRRKRIERQPRLLWLLLLRLCRRRLLLTRGEARNRRERREQDEERAK